MTDDFRIFPGCDLKISTTPLRPVIHRGSRLANGRFASRKMNKTIPFESQNELAFLMRAELDSSVDEIFAQAVELRLPHGRRHIPDFVVSVRGKVEIHEVKEDEDAARPEVADFLRAAARQAELHGAPYHVALKSFLFDSPIYGSLKAISRRRRHHIPFITRLAVLDAIQRHEPISIRDLVDRTKQRGGTEEIILALIAHGEICVDLRSTLGPSSLVWSAYSPPSPARLLPAREDC